MNTFVEISVKALTALGVLLVSAAVAFYAALLLLGLYSAGGLNPETGRMLAATMAAGSFLALLSSMFLWASAPGKPLTRRRKSHG